MSREWNQRVLVTIGWLAAAELLKLVPLPGLWSWDAVSAIAEEWGTAGALLMHAELSVAVAGILPYIGASILVVLARAPLGVARRFDPGAIERSTLALAVPIAMALGTFAAVRWQVALGTQPILPIRFDLVAPAAVSAAAGTALLVAIAHAITRSGVGNGACLLVLVDVVKSFAVSLLPSTTSPSPVLERFLPVVLPTGLALVFATSYVRSRFELRLAPTPAEGAGPAPADGARTVVLRRNVIGVLAVQYALVALMLIVAILPGDSPIRQAMMPNSAPGWGWAIAFAALAVPLTLVVVSWACDTGRLAELASSEGSQVESAAFDRPLEKELLPGQLVLVVAVAGWTVASARFTATLLPLTHLVVAAAIAVALFERRQLHERLAGSFASADDEAVCEACGASNAADAESCRRCGTVFAEELRCATHEDRPAAGRCVVCHAPLCDGCDRPRAGCHRCGAHAGVEVVDGWVVATRATTHAEAQRIAHRLAAGDVGSEILATTVAPLFGTLGLYDVVPAFPLGASSSCGGGTVSLLVRPADLERALRLLEPGPAGA